MRQPDYELRANIAELREQGLGTHAIAAQLNKSVQAILAMELRMGVPKRKPGFPPCPEIAKRNEAIYSALQAGANPEALAEQYGISRQYVAVIRYQKSRGR